MSEELEPRIRVLRKDRDCAIWCAKRMAGYGIVWGTCGTLAVENEDGLLVEIGANHLKSMVRRDYLEAHGSHPGLNRIIDDVMNYARGYAKCKPEESVFHTLHGKLNT